MGIAYVYLGAAVLAEAVATSALKASEEFTRPLPTALVIVGYGLAFYLLTLVLRSMQVGVVYAIWSGLGVVLVTAIAAVIYREIPDWPALVGMGMIVAGVAIINIYSQSAGH